MQRRESPDAFNSPINSVAKLSEGLSDTQSEKFAALVEHVSSDDVNEFETKITSLKESYFKAADPAKETDETLITESDHSTDNVVNSSEWDKIIKRASGL